MEDYFSLFLEFLSTVGDAFPGSETVLFAVFGVDLFLPTNRSDRYISGKVGFHR